jgi:hypothetical protein
MPTGKQSLLQMRTGMTNWKMISAIGAIIWSVSLPPKSWATPKFTTAITKFRGFPLLIGNRRSRSVDFGEMNCELLVVSQRSILKDTDRQGLSQLYG